MKFILSTVTNKMTEVKATNGAELGTKALEWIKERGAVNQYNPKIQDDGSWFWEWVWYRICDSFADLGHTIVLHLPDIVGYATIGTGIFVILGAMLGRGGMLKPLAYWVSLVIAALCILGGN